MTVRHLTVEYNKLNEQGTFSPGDILSGRVTVVTSKETKVQSLLVKAKGKAEVTWSDQQGQTAVAHRDKKKYFYFQHIILQDKNKGDGLYIIIGYKVFVLAFFNVSSLDSVSELNILQSNEKLTNFLLSIRFRNHWPWEECVSFHLCDSKDVRVLL